MKKSSDKAAALLEQRLCIDPKRYNEIMVMREKLMKSPGIIEISICITSISHRNCLLSFCCNLKEPF